MRRTPSAILAFCLLGVVPETAGAQVPVAPPASTPAVVATADVSADAAGVAVGLKASVDTSGGASGTPSVGGTAKTEAAGVDVAASAGAGTDGVQAAVDVAVSTETTSPARPTMRGAGAGERASRRPEAPNARNPEAAGPAVRRVAPTQRTDGAAESVGRRLRDGGVPVSISPRTRVENDRRADRSGGDADPSTGGSSPDEVVPPGGGVSSAAALFSFVAVLIPLAGWTLGHTATAFPRQVFSSFLERPG
jgi:hypothetical protein